LPVWQASGPRRVARQIPLTICPSRENEQGVPATLFKQAAFLSWRIARRCDLAGEGGNPSIWARAADTNIPSARSIPKAIAVGNFAFDFIAVPFVACGFAPPTTVAINGKHFVMNRSPLRMSALLHQHRRDTELRSKSAQVSGFAQSRTPVPSSVARGRVWAKWKPK
jgi:hypothetical protein